jgi:hypothetical protein
VSAGLLVASCAQAQTSAGARWQIHHAERLSSTPAADSPLARLGVSDARAMRSKLLATQALSARRPTPAALAGGSAKIEGVVTAAETNETLAGIQVCAYTSDEEVEECAETGSTGEYQIPGLPPGQYDVEFFASESSGQDYVTQYYNGKPNEGEADPVTLGSNEEEVAKGVNAALIKGADIKGKVVSASTKAPLVEVLVCAFDSADETARCTLTDAGGNYTVIGLAVDSYEVQFLQLEDEYAPQYYNGKLQLAEAEPVEVLAPGSVVSGIDAELHARPVAIEKPVIVGATPVQGISLSLIPGSWSGEPTIVTDEWGRCNSAGGECFTIAEGPTYTPTAKDVGHRLRIRERATSEFGEGKESFSVPSAIVLAPSHEGGESTPPPSGASPAGPTAPTAVGGDDRCRRRVGRAGVENDRRLRGSAEVAAAQLVDPPWRAGEDRRAEKASPLHGLVRLARRGQALCLVVRGAEGRPSRGSQADARRERQRRHGPGGTTKLTIKLSARGSKLLAHRKQLTLTAKGTLTPSGQSALHATRSFTLEH